MADVDGDGDQDVCARANAGIRCAAFEAGGFGESFEGPALADDQGWGSIRFFSTLRLADIDGDGMADLCGRSQAGVQCWPSLGTGFAAPPIVGPAWSDDSGWDAPEYYATMRMSTAAPSCHLIEQCDDGIDDDCDGEVDEGCDDGSSDGAGDDTGGGSSATDPSDGDPSAAGSDEVGSSDDDALPTTFGENGDDGGCGCSATPRGNALTLLAIASVFAHRRRQRRLQRVHAVTRDVAERTR